MVLRSEISCSIFKTRTDSAQALLSQVAEEIAKIPDIETRQNTAAYTEILAFFEV